MNSEIKELADWAGKNGWTVKDDSKGYTKFRDANGNYVAQYPATPGNPHRRLMDLKTALKRAGLEIPPPSKKVQRARTRGTRKESR